MSSTNETVFWLIFGNGFVALIKLMLETYFKDVFQVKLYKVSQHSYVHVSVAWDYDYRKYYIQFPFSVLFQIGRNDQNNHFLIFSPH